MTPIDRYLQRIALAVESITDTRVEFYVEQLLSATRANLRFKLRWPTGEFLEVSEAIELRENLIVWLSYRYHFQSADLTLRYDNTPHHPELATHPEHRHQETIVEAGERPDLEKFLQESRERTRRQ